MNIEDVLKTILENQENIRISLEIICNRLDVVEKICVGSEPSRSIVTRERVSGDGSTISGVSEDFSLEEKKKVVLSSPEETGAPLVDTSLDTLETGTTKDSAASGDRGSSPEEDQEGGKRPRNYYKRSIRGSFS